jgi:cephalosporin-C deacetylase-like acetyl esterase
MMVHFFVRCCSVASCFVLAAAALAGELVVRPEPASGVVGAGEPVVWHVQWRGDDPPADVRYKVELGFLTELDSGVLKLEDGRCELKASLSRPGSLLAHFSAKPASGEEQQALGGVIIAPDKIKASAKRPGDFDAFWDAKIEEIKRVPFNAKLERADSGREGVEYWKITLDGYGGTKIRGQLARPKVSNGNDNRKLPALFIPQWAGVYPIEKAWAVDRAAEGWLVLNMLAHDLPIDEPAEFYQEKLAGPLRDYWAIGNDDRETSYFLRMYLSCYQSLEYLRSRPDWDGKTLVVNGASQGGQQTLVAAALHPGVTAALAMVPAGCDMLGPAVNRMGGWPGWYDCLYGKDPAKVREAARYFDVVNFAPRIKCPVLVGYGLVDQICPPEGIQVAANKIASPKEVIPLPQGAHLEKDGSHQAYYKRLNEVWLPALRDGKPVPPPTAE